MGTQHQSKSIDFNKHLITAADTAPACSFAEDSFPRGTQHNLTQASLPPKDAVLIWPLCASTYHSPGTMSIRNLARSLAKVSRMLMQILVPNPTTVPCR